MRNIIKEYWKYLFGRDKNDNSSVYEPLLEVCATTAFNIDDVMEFKILTGKTREEVVLVLKEFTSVGLYSLQDVNKIIKLGYYDN